MKKIIVAVVLCAVALTATLTAISSCEKAENLKQSTTASTKKPGNGATEKVNPPYGSVSVLSGVCAQITCGPPSFVTLSQNNRIQITKDAYTISNYPANMRYTLYVRGSVVSGTLYNISQVLDFNCTQNAPIYANSVLANGMNYFIRITDAAGPTPPTTDIVDITTPSPYIPFTSGNSKGLPC